MEAVRKEANWPLACFIGLNIADCLITWQVISLGGNEINWFGVLFMPVWGMLLLKMGIAAIVAAWIYRNRRRWFNLLNIGMGLIVAYNLGVLVVSLRLVAYYTAGVLT